MINRRKEMIKSKGFDMFSRVEDEAPAKAYVPKDFSRIKVGTKAVEDATIDLGNYHRMDSDLGKKSVVLEAIRTGDLEKMRDISNYFYRTSGIYSRLCRYMAYIFKYDWMVTPYIESDAVNNETLIKQFNKVLKYLDEFKVKQFCGEAALKVIRNGCYYGYLLPAGDKMIIQELPVKYCRSKFNSMGRPVIEFNMAFFRDCFPDKDYRLKVLKTFPDEFAKGYKLYLEGKLPREYHNLTGSWYVLDVDKTIRFNLNDEFYPAFISVIPAIIDLDEAQALDRQKMRQQLLKLIIQKMPIDNNGDLVFDVDEAQQLHNNAVNMLSRAIGIDVLTTFADVDVASMYDSTTTASSDELEKVERAIYNEAGVSQKQFNTDSNIALEKSILNDEASMLTLLNQFEDFINTDLLKKFNTTKKFTFKAQLLPTSIYNYQDLSKLYKEQTQLGYSKMLPQIALGQSQRTILANATFENEILDLVNLFIPPLMSSTMNSDVLDRAKGGSADASSDSDGAGRKELDDDEKSEKTIKNRESMN